MSAAAVHRDAIIDTAARLFRQQGYAATGLNQIVAESGAPKGSLYHYFPAGKTAIAEAALRHAGAKVTATLRRLADRDPDPAVVFRRYCALLAGWMQASGYRDGCPITTTLLETAPGHAALRDVGAQVFAQWAALLAQGLRARGVPPARARRLASVAVAALEGALIQMRVDVTAQPLRHVAREIGGLLASA